MAQRTNDPILRIETLDQALPRRGRGLAAPASIALHVAGLAALGVLPVLLADELPEPTTAVRAFLTQPPGLTAIAPPPPPAAPSAAPARPAPPPPPRESRLRAPLAIPPAIPADLTREPGIEGGAGGVSGGVEGGVPGGVVGGIVGGAPAAPPPPVRPVRVGEGITEPRKVKHVPPHYPDLARRGRLSGHVVVEALIGPDGRVHDVTVLRSIPILDEAATAAVRQWVYTPTRLNGVPVPVLMTVTVRFVLKGR